MSETKTVQLRHRLVSFDGGEHYKSGVALTTQELESHWDALLAAMDPAARAETERHTHLSERKAFLVRYLGAAPAHLIIDTR